MKTKAIMPLQTILRQILATLTNNASDFAEMYDDMAVLEERTRIANVVKYCSIIVSNGNPVSADAEVLCQGCYDWLCQGINSRESICVHSLIKRFMIYFSRNNKGVEFQ